MNRISLLLVAAFCLLIGSASMATTTASFTVSSTVACAWTSVTFTDATSTTHPGHLRYYWSFDYADVPSWNTATPPPIHFSPSAPNCTLNVFDSVDGTSSYYSVRLTINPLPNIASTSSSSTQLNCSGDSVTMSVTASTGGLLRRLWTNPDATTDTATVHIGRMPGSYQAVLIDSNGCRSNPWGVYINGGTAFDIQITTMGSSGYSDSLTLCDFDSYSGLRPWLYNNVVGFWSWPITYTWYDGSTMDHDTIGSTGLYYLRAVDAHGCVARDTVYVRVNHTPSGVIGSTGTPCVGDTTTLSAPSGLHYVWSTYGSTLDTTSSIRVTTSEYYMVTVTSAAGCSSHFGAYVYFNPHPYISLGVPTYLSVHLATSATTIDTFKTCTNFSSDVEGPVYYMGGPHYAYQWIGTTDTSYSIPVTTTGLYRMLLTDIGTGCSSKDSVYVIVHASPDTTVTQSIHALLCEGDNQVLRATPAAGNTYLWSTGATDDSIIVTTTGVYSVFVTNAFGCPLNSSSRTQTFHHMPTPSVSAGPCVAMVGTIDTTSHYQWLLGSGSTISGATSYSYVPSASGFYAFRETTPHGCIAFANYEYITCSGGGSTTDSCTLHPMASVSILATGVCSISCSLPATHYAWYLNGILISGSDSMVIHVTTPGYYYVKAFNSYGCESASSVMWASCTTGVVDLKPEADALEIYPNPASDVLNVKGELTSVTILNTMGQVMNVSGNNPHAINVEALSAGIYYVKIMTPSGNEINKRFVKQ